MSAGANLGAGRSGPMPQGRLYSVATFANLTGAPISAFNHAKLLRGHFASACLVLPGPGDIVDRAEAAGVPVLMLPMVNRGLRSRLLRLSLVRDLLACAVPPNRPAFRRLPFGAGSLETEAAGSPKSMAKE